MAFKKTMNTKTTVVLLRSWHFWHPLSRQLCSYKLPIKQSDSNSYSKATIIKTVVLVRERHKSMQQNRKPSHLGKQLGSSLKKKKENLHSITIQHNNYTLAIISEKWKFTCTQITINKYNQSSFTFNCAKRKSAHTSFTGDSDNKLCGIDTCHVVLCLVTQSLPTLCYPMDYSPPGSSVLGDSPGKNTGGGCQALLQGIFPTQGSNPGFPHVRWIL